MITTGNVTDERRQAEFARQREAGAYNSEVWPELGYTPCVNGWAEAVVGDRNNTFRCHNVSSHQKHGSCRDTRITHSRPTCTPLSATLPSVDPLLRVLPLGDGLTTMVVSSSPSASMRVQLSLRSSRTASSSTSAAYPSTRRPPSGARSALTSTTWSSAPKPSATASRSST